MQSCKYHDVYKNNDGLYKYTEFTEFTKYYYNCHNIVYLHLLYLWHLHS